MLWTLLHPIMEAREEEWDWGASEGDATISLIRQWRRRRAPRIRRPWGCPFHCPPSQFSVVSVSDKQALPGTCLSLLKDKLQSNSHAVCVCVAFSYTEENPCKNLKTMRLCLFLIPPSPKHGWSPCFIVQLCTLKPCFCSLPASSRNLGRKERCKEKRNESGS